MLRRRRSRPAVKDQMFLHDTNQAQNSEQKARKSSSFFTVPGLFVGLSSKVVPDSESARSPTSPLDYKLFSSLSNTLSRSPISSPVHPKSWDSGKVGLGLVDSLKDVNNYIALPMGTSNNKNILLCGSQMKINIPNPKAEFCTNPLSEAPRSLPKDYGINLFTKVDSDPKKAEFEIGELGKLRSYSADGSIFRSSSSVSLSRDIYDKSKSSSGVLIPDCSNAQSGVMNVDSSQGLVASLSATDIELSEDYTCIVSHGPNPKTTHIFGDCILESNSIESPDFINKFCGEAGRSSWLSEVSSSSSGPSDEFLSFCFSCKKKLEEGKDIYMYRGEKAFCSCKCREQEILIEEEMVKPTTECLISPSSSFHGDDLFAEEMTVSSS